MIINVEHRGEEARQGVDRRSMALLSAGHACVDACQGAVPALLPFMVVEHGLSVTAAAALVFAATVSSAIVQPLFGAYSDRTDAPWLLPAGVVLGCAGVAVAGIAPSYPLVFTAILLSGLGVAAYHPEGSRFANYVSGTQRATGMSYYSLGGNIGFALGPIFVTPVLLLVGLSGSLVFLIPALVFGIVLSAELSRLMTFHPRAQPKPARSSPLEDCWKGFRRLLATICLRSFAFYTLLALVPLYFIDVLGSSEALANTALTGMLVFGAVGTLVGGRLADRIGRRPVLVGSLVLQLPLLAVATAVGEAPAMAALALLGFVAISSFSVTVVMGQEYLPNRIGLASGFTLGAAVGIGGLAAPVFGLIGDEFGLRTAILALGGLPALGTLVALTLPPAPGSLAVARGGESRSGATATSV
jgi:MFS transporter, FSR family, fosmidomycin resistance protein